MTEAVKQPASMVRNAIANGVGQACVALLNLLIVRLYIGHLGAEGFGVMGFALLLQSMVGSLDLGLTQTVAREIARLASSADSHQESRSFLGTFEVLAAGLSMLTAAILVALAPWISSEWLSSERIPKDLLARALSVVALQCGLQWMVLVYQAALLGMERQVVLNTIRVTEASVRLGGSALLLIFGAVDLEELLRFQTLSLAIGVLALAIAAHRLLARGVVSARATSLGAIAGAHLAHLQRVWRFGAGMAAITLSGFVLVNVDRLLVSKLVSLEAYGAYAIAWIGASAIPTIIAGPLYAATFPRFVAAVTVGDATGLRNLFHLKTQLMAVLVIPTAAVMTFSGRALIQAWIGDSAVADSASAAMAFLAWGAAVNALMLPTFALQLASDWLSFPVRLNAALVCVFVPVCWVMVMRYGATGAAVSFLLMNSAYLIFALPWTLRRLLPGELAPTLALDIAPPAALSALALGILTSVVRAPTTQLGAVLQPAVIWSLLVLTLALLPGSPVRRLLRSWFGVAS
ncbi:MAG: lipopolysaccharide biosynthesis protein [Myxococcaceae bacterium]